MGIINILNENVSNVIAAGEVVENYSSLIKELLENSFDAGAKNIIIEISNNLSLIKITDDGCGMVKEDIYLSIERHATSKLKTKEDIYNINTFGFRGEALASISSVSKFSLASKTKDDKMGHKIIAYGGNITKTQDVAMKTGTIIEIRDLFFNVPARKKFLKKESTEISNIKDIVIKLAMSNYNTALSLIIDGRTVVKTTGTGMDNTIFELLGKNIFKNLKKFKYGYLGNEEIVRGTKNNIYTFINSRYCKSNVMERAVIDAYYMKLMKDKYPFAIIYYDINPSEVDVNVHPSKKIVKFSDDKIVYSQIKDEIKEFFYYDDRKDFKKEDLKENNKDKEIDIDNTKNNFEYKDNEYIQSIFSVKDVKEESFEILAQAFDTYMIVKNNDSIDFYDQHACHERIKYEELREKYTNQVLGAKQLLFPEIIEFTPLECNIIMDNISVFNEFMFDIDRISETELIVRSVPDFELRNTTKNILTAMLESLRLNNTVTDIRERIIISIACRSSVMAGQKLSHSEMLALVKKINEIKKFNCPHGRPVISKISKDMLDKLAKRKL